MSGPGEDLIRYRLERAREALADARALADRTSWEGCVNRLYYACFYAVSALLLRRGLASSKHTGVRSLFNKHFVKTGEVAKDAGDVFNRLFEYRKESDYMDFARFAGTDVRPWVSQAEDFVARVAALAAAPR